MFCPGCGTVITVPQAFCKSCGARLPVAGAAPVPAAPAAAPAMWEGRDLVLDRLAAVPMSNCLGCGSPGPDIRPKEKNFVYVPPLVYLGLLGGVLPAIVLVLIFQKRATALLPLCDSCRSKWMLSSILWPFYVVVGLFAIPAIGGFIGYQIAGDPASGIGVLLGFLVWLVSICVLPFVWLNRVQIRCRKIDDRTITIRLPNPEAVQAAWGVR